MLAVAASVCEERAASTSAAVELAAVAAALAAQLKSHARCAALVLMKMLEEGASPAPLPPALPLGPLAAAAGEPPALTSTPAPLLLLSFDGRRAFAFGCDAVRGLDSSGVGASEGCRAGAA